ncbi:MAG TPA: metallophosphoesterase [Patescibacteria group bacterium]|nr:metallophosphoesterase [Patescibacteria group bacterium]
MKIFATSDLHWKAVKKKGDQSTRRLAEYVCQKGEKNDVLLLLGDQGSSLKHIAELLELFQTFPGKKLAVPGNHDLWSKTGSTEDYYQTVLDLMEIKNFHPLDRAAVKIQGIGFAGCVGWYDYSFKDDEDIPLSYFEKKISPYSNQLCWRDATFCRWGNSDQEVTKKQLKILEKQLWTLCECKTVIVGLHHVPIKSLLFQPRSILPRSKRFTNSFLGSQKFSETIESFPRTRLVLCGHIHRRKSVRNGKILYTSIGSSYRRKELNVITVRGKKADHKVRKF